MSLIKWDNNYSVNVSEFDNQHQKLVEMINELNDAMREGKAKDVLGKIIDGLLDYTGVHFSNEEKYFAQFVYPDTFSHKKEHNDFVKKVTEFKQGFDNGRLMLSMEIMNFLTDWLINHIQKSDKKYSSFFNGKGLK